MLSGRQSCLVYQLEQAVTKQMPQLCSSFCDSATMSGEGSSHSGLSVHVLEQVSALFSTSVVPHLFLSEYSAVAIWKMKIVFFLRIVT